MTETDSKSVKALAAPRRDEASSLAPFRDLAFAVLWTATVVSNIGTWMQSAAAGWLMTGLDRTPVSVSLVQVAASLPMFMFALPAGALADVVDRRRLLIVMQVAVTVLVAGFGLVVYLGWVTPILLLAFTFIAGAAAASISPAWQAIVPQLVPRPHLQSAVALNSVGLNVSRAVGPALAGLIISAWGIAAPFWVNALTTIAVIAALVWWRPAQERIENLPVNDFFERSASVCGTLVTIRIFGRRLSVLVGSSCLRARIGRCCRLSRVTRSVAAQSFTAFCWERLALERSLAPLACRG